MPYWQLFCENAFQQHGKTSWKGKQGLKDVKMLNRNSRLNVEDICSENTTFWWHLWTQIHTNCMEGAAKCSRKAFEQYFSTLMQKLCSYIFAAACSGPQVRESSYYAALLEASTEHSRLEWVTLPSSLSFSSQTLDPVPLTLIYWRKTLHSDEYAYRIPTQS